MRLSSLLFASAPAFVLAIVACSASIGTSAGGTAPPTVAESSKARKAATAPVTDAVLANNAFALDLYSRLRAAPASTGNVVTSPVSASVALTMTFAGAGGNTASQMATALHLGSSSSTIFDSQNSLMQALDGRAAAALANDAETADMAKATAPSPSDYDLELVDSVWGEQSYTWQPTFLDRLAQDYGTGVYLADFEHAWEPARQSINAWVSGQTSDKINDLVADGSLSGATRMVLVNAIHLKLPWATAFATTATSPAPFTRSDGTTVTMQRMNQLAKLDYVDDGGAQIVSLPLAGGQLAVVIALPHGDLATYEAGLTASSAALATPTTQALVNLYLPKVAFTSPTFSLAHALKAMGMTDAFDVGLADFTGLCAHPADDENLYVADVLQKATIAMGESGVEAAAATAVILDADASVEVNPPQQVPMVVDRPYLVSIVDVPTGAVLFLGHIEDPTDAGTP